MARLGKAFRWMRRFAEALLTLALLADVAHAAGDAVALIGAGEASLAGARGRDVYLDTVVNGAAHGLVHFGARGRALWASAASLRQLGFVLPPGTPDPVALSSLPGLQLDYDASGQRLNLIAPLALLKLPETSLQVPGIVTRPATSSPGLLLNYDLFGTRGERATTSISAYTELRAFGPWGVLSSTALSQQLRSSDQSQHNTVRLDTSWSQSWPERLLTLRLGDTLTSSLGWSRATRMGGIQLGSNFALQPYLTTAPAPALLGSATLPSQVDLYVNGMRQYNGQVPAGPFQLNTLPNITGAGNAQVVLTDAFGRSTTLNFALYGTPQLLKKGLTSWSAELGWVRKDYGVASSHYGHDPMLSGTWRHGLTDGITLEAHGETTSGLVNAGTGGSWLLGQAGVLSGSLAASSGTGMSGTQLGLGYSWSNSRYSVNLAGTHTQGDYRDVAARYGSSPARASGSASLGYNTDQAGSFSLSYLTLNYPGQAASRYVSAGWIKSLGGGASLSLMANRDLVDSRYYSLFAYLSWAMDERTSASVGLQRDNAGTHATASSVRATPSDGGWGWNARLREGQGQHGAQAEANYLGPWGRYTAGVNDAGDNRYAYGGANGALVFMDGRPFAARQIYDSFALVSTGVAGVPVLLENRRVGTTDANGHLLVTPLNAYQNNQLAIDVLNLPANLRFERVMTIATPKDRAGTVVSFGIEKLRSALVTLVDAAGQPLPLGSRVRVNDQDAGALVGYDGEVYLDQLSDSNLLAVQTPVGACAVRFEHHEEESGAIPRIGPLACMPEAK